MIGKPHWFARRKYTGWGFTPKTWQGWVYILIMVAPIAIIANLKNINNLALVFLIVWIVIFIIDFIHISLNIEKDERDKIHEAITERNALWVIILILVIGIAYQTAISVATNNTYQVDPIILIALGGGLIVKIISNVYLDKRD